MNPSGYCGRGKGYDRASSLRGTQPQAGHATSASGQRHYFSQAQERGYRQRPLSQRYPQRYPGQARAPEPNDISKAFRLLRTNPWQALDAAEVLVDRYSTHPSHGVSVFLLKARALLQLNKIDDCIAFINSLETRAQNDKGLLMTKARALQTRGSFNEALALFQHLYVNYQEAYKDHKVHGLGLGRLLQLMGGADNLEKALAIYTRLRARTAGGRVGSPCNAKEIELTLGRHLEVMGGGDNMEQALAIYTRLRTRAAAGKVNTPCDDKDIELTLGRHLQLMGGADNLEKALAIFTRLRSLRAAGRVNTPCNDKEIELTLGRHFELMGGADNLEKALAIFTRLRALRAGGRVKAPCNDKEIELALGRLLQLMGGEDNQQQVLAIFTRLRAQAAGSTNTPCNDKDIELTLGRHLQLMGGGDNLEKALAIYTRLRARAAGGRANRPCNDKEIELSLGRLFEHKGSEPDLEQALAIYTRLRARATGGRENTPCHDKDIELSLASLSIKRGNWPQFDELQLETRRFPGFESHLWLSVRYWQELLETKIQSCAHSRLMGKAIRSAVLAIEASGFTHASCISQLAHCLRLVSCWPNVLLKKRGLQHKETRRFRTAAKFLFDTADQLAPGRQQLEKDQHWRAREQELLALLS